MKNRSRIELIDVNKENENLTEGRHSSKIGLNENRKNAKI